MESPQTTTDLVFFLESGKNTSNRLYGGTSLASTLFRSIRWLETTSGKPSNGSELYLSSLLRTSTTHCRPLDLPSPQIWMPLHYTLSPRGWELPYSRLPTNGIVLKRLMFEVEHMPSGNGSVLSSAVNTVKDELVKVWEYAGYGYILHQPAYIAKQITSLYESYKKLVKIPVNRRYTPLFKTKEAGFSKLQDQLLDITVASLRTRQSRRRRTRLQSCKWRRSSPGRNDIRSFPPPPLLSTARRPPPLNQSRSQTPLRTFPWIQKKSIHQRESALPAQLERLSPSIGTS